MLVKNTQKIKGIFLQLHWFGVGLIYSYHRIELFILSNLNPINTRHKLVIKEAIIFKDLSFFLRSRSLATLLWPPRASQPIYILFWLRHCHSLKKNDSGWKKTHYRCMPQFCQQAVKTAGKYIGVSLVVHCHCTLYRSAGEAWEE